MAIMDFFKLPINTRARRRFLDKLVSDLDWTFFDKRDDRDGTYESFRAVNELGVFEICHQTMWDVNRMSFHTRTSMVLNCNGSQYNIISDVEAEVVFCGVKDKVYYHHNSVLKQIRKYNEGVQMRKHGEEENIKSMVLNYFNGI